MDDQMMLWCRSENSRLKLSVLAHSQGLSSVHGVTMREPTQGKEVGIVGSVKYG